MTQLFVEMSPARRARRLEAVRTHLRRLLREVGAAVEPDLLLSAVAASWLTRLQVALVDERISTEAYRELDWQAFREIRSDEHDEFWRRLSEYNDVREAYPAAARSTREALLPVAEALASQAA
jgi:hypothetical protein